MNKSKNAALGGVLTAIGLSILYLACVFPARLGLCALAGISISVAAIRAGLRGSILVYFSTALLGWFLVPDKIIALAYIAVFGPYTLTKYVTEKYCPVWLAWTVKIVFCNMQAIFIIKAAAGLFSLFPSRLTQSNWLFLIFLNILFIAYDFAYSKLLAFFSALFHTSAGNGI